MPDPLGRTWGIRPKPVKFPHLRVHLHQPLFFHHKKGLEGTSEAKGLGEEWKRDFPLELRTCDGAGQSFGLGMV